jgi:hypothetical protein
MQRRLVGAIGIGVSLLSTTLVHAQSGAAVVRVNDGVSNTRCVNAAKDQVWLTLRRVITDKNAGWLTQDAQVATIFSATVRPSGSDGKPLTFPLAAEATLRGFSNGQVSIPIEYTLVDGFALKQGQALYSGIGIEMTLLNLQKRTTWGNALQALNAVAKKLPLPNTPLAQTASYILELANSAVDKDMQAIKDDKSKSASLALNFDPTGSCGGKAGNGSDFERTGTIAVIQDKGDATGLVVPIKEINSYCWTADLTPVFMLKAAKKEQVACSDGAHYATKYHQVTNNYVGFFLNAIERNPQLADTPRVKADKEAARQRCLANGVAATACF